MKATDESKTSMPGFSYTHGGGVLTEEQRQFYEDNGYLVIRNHINEDLVQELRQRFLDFCDGKVDPGFAEIVKDPYLKKQGVEGEHLIFKIQDFLNDEVFFKYCQHKSVIDIVESIIGPDITAIHGMFFNKPPDTNPGFSLHPMHQDLYYFNFRPANGVTAAWTALERVDETNGCLYVLPGTHKWDLQKHGYIGDVKNFLYHGVAGFDDVPRINLVMEKGDTVFFHPLVLHGSGPNRSKGFRKAITVHYVNSNNHFIDVKGTVQEDIAEEILALYSAKWAKSLTFVDYYKIKSRLVKGPPGNFQKMTSYVETK